MTEKEKNSNTKPNNALNKCPRCGKPLKRMRCRIDEAEMYCPGCGQSFDPRVIEARNSK